MTDKLSTFEKLKQRALEPTLPEAMGITDDIAKGINDLLGQTFMEMLDKSQEQGSEHPLGRNSEVLTTCIAKVKAKYPDTNVETLNLFLGMSFGRFKEMEKAFFSKSGIGGLLGGLLESLEEKYGDDKDKDE